MSDVRYTKKRGVLGEIFHHFEMLYAWIFRKINEEITWDKLSPGAVFGLANLLGLRIDLRNKNLFDTDGDLTQPKSDFSADFIEADLLHTRDFLGRLRGGADAVSRLIWSQMSDHTKAVIETLQAKAATVPAAQCLRALTRDDHERHTTTGWQLRCVLVAELNKIIGRPFYTPELFRGIELSSQTTSFLAHHPNGEDSEWLNRWLLEEVYPLELRRNRDRVRVCEFNPGPGATKKRTEDGSMNDLEHPAMGCRFSRLGRNMQNRRPVEGRPGLLHPNPLLVSERLLARKGKFQPATTLNLLAGAWIQFQVHDWFSHENEHQEAGKDIEVPRAGDWPPQNPEAQTFLPKSDGMLIPQTKPDPTNSYPLNSRFPAFRNKDPQWWDGSQVYGESVAETLRLRTDPATRQLCPQGKLYLDPGTGLLPLDENGHIVSGFTDNWWLGIEILHTLFAKEHNAICSKVARTEPHLTDQEIFEVARLVNCAIMAKIHTVEWTPGILGHPAIQPALNVNWMGFIGHFFGEKTARAVAPWIPTDTLKDILTGAPLSEPEHHGAPYSLTEEFNAVYRLHPLLPDDILIRRIGQGQIEKTYKTPEVSFERTRRPIQDSYSMDDLVYSFGVAHPGAITIQNYPDFLRELVLPEDAENGRPHRQVMDLGAVDLIRDRERGVPRYCEFRRQLRMRVPGSWLELAGCRPDLAPELQQVYENDLEAVDNMVGMFCEKNPQGFGFSDTAFRIFILMASRRLKSDRFFTSCYTEEYYTRTGLDWIAATGLREVIERHHPALGAYMPAGKNPFAPWPVGRR